MDNTLVKDCIVLPFEDFDGKLKAQKDLEREMIKKFGKGNFRLRTLYNCVMAEFKSETEYF